MEAKFKQNRNLCVTGINVPLQLIMNTTNKMQLYRLIYYSKSALHVLDDVFAHYHEHLTLFTASGNIHQCRCQRCHV